ncbi:YHS domain protein [Phycisphaerae bacterium RAS2]|nr:YHS domain protein [Phycisphaerae bacterium RAS2]
MAVRTATAEGPVFFCCDNCIKKYGADPKKYAEQVVTQRKALEKLARVQVTCPISGEPVKPAIFVEDKGTKIFFCCKNCRGKYEDDRAKYTPRLADTFTYQTKCPVTGKGIDPQISASAPAGETVFFCCKDCPEKFRKDPEKFAPKLEEQGFRLDLSRKKP